MESTLIFFAILQSISISLGVGSSTLAIASFFVAIADGKIDPLERKMMGVIYVALRVAMVMILVTTTWLMFSGYYDLENNAVSAYVTAFYILIAVLYLNAILMTMRIMPSKFGPSLQASTWYTLGILSTLLSLSVFSLTFTHFTVAYLVTIAFATLLVNGLMHYLKAYFVNKPTA